MEQILPTEALASAANLSKVYDEYLANLEENVGERPPGIHASEISKCHRAAVYTMRGETKKKWASSTEERAKGRRTFNQGHAIHNMIQRDYEKIAEWNPTIQFKREVPISPDRQPLAAKWNIYSSCDGVFTLCKRNNETWEYEPYLRIGLEIKSSKSSTFAELRQPEPSHIEQIHVYMAVLQLPAVWMLYFNKDNQNYTPPTPPWLVPFDKLLWQKLETRFADWHKHIEIGTLPQPMHGFHCSYCSYAWTCNPPKRTKRSSPLPPLASAGFRKL